MKTNFSGVFVDMLKYSAMTFFVVVAIMTSAAIAISKQNTDVTPKVKASNATFSDIGYGV